MLHHISDKREKQNTLNVTNNTTKKRCFRGNENVLHEMGRET